MAYSGNMFEFNDAIAALRNAGMKVHVGHWLEPAAFVFKACIRVETESGAPIADMTFIHRDADCLIMMGTSWLRKVRTDLEGWL